MTVTSTTTSVERAGNGTATEFSFSPIRIFDETQLEVVVRDASDVLTTIPRGTGASSYAVVATFTEGESSTGAIRYPESGGTVLPTGSYINIRRVIPNLQDVSIENQGGYLPEVQEEMHDLHVMRAQQLSEEIERCVKVPFGSELGTADYLTAVREEAAAAAASAAAAAASNVAAGTTYTAPWTGAIGRTTASKFEDVIDARDVLVETASDQTTKLNNLIDSVADAGGGRIQLPPFTVVTENVSLRQGVWLQGQGAASILKVADGANVNDFMHPKNYTSTGTDDQYIIASHFYIDGNKANQTSGTGNSIIFSYDAGYGANGVARHMVHNMYILNSRGTSLVFGNDSRDSCASMVYAYAPDAYGFQVAGGDINLSQCISGQSGLSGFLIQSGGFQIADSKGWYSGRIERTGGAVTNNGQGFRVRNGSAAELLLGQMVNCQSQENNDGGFLFFGAGGVIRSMILSGCVSNSDNGVALSMDNMYDSQMQFAVNTTSGLLFTPTNGASFFGGSARNSLYLTCPSDYVSGGALTGVNLADNQVEMAGMQSPDRQTTGATYTLNSIHKRVAHVTLDQNITLANPTLAVRGWRIRYVLTQNGTGGWTTSFGTRFKTNSPSFTTTAGKISIIEFECDGTDWVQSSFITGL